MGTSCLICRKTFNPEGHEAVCSKCRGPTQKEKDVELKIKAAELEAIKDTEVGPWVVVFLSVSGPSEISPEFETKGEAKKFTSDIHNGISTKYQYLKDSERLRIYHTDYRNKGGRTVIPVGSLDGIRAEDFD